MRNIEFIFSFGRKYYIIKPKLLKILSRFFSLNNFLRETIIWLFILIVASSKKIFDKQFWAHYNSEACVNVWRYVKLYSWNLIPFHYQISATYIKRSNTILCWPSFLHILNITWTWKQKTRDTTIVWKYYQVFETRN